MTWRKMPNVSVLHCIATYAFCAALVLVSVWGDLVITPYLLSIPLHSEPREVSQQAAEILTIRAAQRLHAGALEIFRAPQMQLTHIPWTASNPMGHLILSYGLLALLLPICWGCRALHKTMRLPTLAAFRKHMHSSRSSIGHGIARMLGHFEDSAYVGVAANMPRKVLPVMLAMVTMLWLGSQYLWAVSLNHISLPAANILIYLYIFFVALGTRGFEDRISLFKLFCAFLSWIGLFIFYFPSHGTSPATPALEVAEYLMWRRGGMCAWASACMFAGYLMAYRLLNPPGSIARILGWQGFGVLGVGVFIVLPLVHFTHVERFCFPSVKSDWIALLLNAIFRGLQLYMLNGALRWGDPFCVASVIPSVCAISYLLEGMFTGDDAGFVVTHSKIFAVLFTLGSCGLFCNYYFSKVIILRAARVSWTDSDDISQDEEENGALLVVGDEYKM